MALRGCGARVEAIATWAHGLAPGRHVVQVIA
jgi:hypothetical protein